MSAFYVGQRVRLTGATNPRFAAMVGKTGVITRAGIEANHWVVDIDGYGERWIDGRHACAWGEQHLEPITPPHEAGDWHEIDKLLPNLRGVTA